MNRWWRDVAVGVVSSLIVIALGQVTGSWSWGSWVQSLRGDVWLSIIMLPLSMIFGGFHIWAAVDIAHTLLTGHPDADKYDWWSVLLPGAIGLGIWGFVFFLGLR